MDTQNITFNINGWNITLTGNKKMQLVNIDHREDYGVDVVWEDGQAKVMPKFLSSMTVEEATTYANQMVEATNAASEITAKVREHINNFPA